MLTALAAEGNRSRYRFGFGKRSWAYPSSMIEKIKIAGEK